MALIRSVTCVQAPIQTVQHWSLSRELSSTLAEIQHMAQMANIMVCLLWRFQAVVSVNNQVANSMIAVFAGKDPSRALASSSLKPEDCRPDWYDLPDKEKTV